MTNLWRLNVLAILLIAGVSFNVNAAQPRGYVNSSGIMIAPLLEIGIKTDDNYLNQYRGGVSSNVFTEAPSVFFGMDDGVNKYETTLGFESGRFSADCNDNYLDSYFEFRGHREPNYSSRWDFTVDARHVTEPRGTGSTFGASKRFDEPITYDVQKAAVNYEYGALSTQARFAVNAQLYSRRYNNFRTFSAFQDYASFLFGSGFYYSISRKTETFIELSQDTIRYERVYTDGLFRDSYDTRASLGLQWEATALTTGRAKIGLQRKSFHNSHRENFSGVSWKVDVDWQPLSYSTVTLTSSSNAKDTTLSADYLKETLVGIVWQHDWREYFTSTVRWANLQEEYIGGSFDRTDETRIFDLNVKYPLLPWLGISPFIQIKETKSPSRYANISKNVVGVNFVLAML